MKNDRGKNLCKMKRMGEKWNKFVYLTGARNANQIERISLPKPALARTEVRSGASLMCILEGPHHVGSKLTQACAMGSQSPVGAAL